MEKKNPKRYCWIEKGKLNTLHNNAHKKLLISVK